ncbi:MAG: hypothetical protein CUN56_06230 [Phototrophicales bacterium]|nr:MAG: hypothetical protein CUN56_06230 [Phototrophicales bacterium]
MVKFLPYRHKGRNHMARIGLLISFILIIINGSIAQSREDLRVLTAGPIRTLDPSIAFDAESILLANIYEPLVWLDETGEPTPALATSWQVSDDQLSWTFNLREGVFFHDGAPLTAEAVVRSLNRTRYGFNTSAAYFWSPVLDISALDDLTVQITLMTPTPLALIVGAEYGAWIISPNALDAAEADPSWFDQGNAAGTGAYQLTSVTDNTYTLTRFDAYWGEPAQIRRVEIQVEPDMFERVRLQSDGEVDLAFFQPNAAFTPAFVEKGFKIATYPSLVNILAFLNTSRPPLDDVRVRQAIAYAIPYDNLVALDHSGSSTQARGAVPSIAYAHAPSTPQYYYDIEQARALIAESGVNPADYTLWLTYSVEEYGLLSEIAPVLEAALLELGFGVNVQPTTLQEQYRIARRQSETAEQDIALIRYVPGFAHGGVEHLATLFYDNPYLYLNFSYWQNPDYDSLVGQAIRTEDEARYSQAQTMLVEASPALFLLDEGRWFAIPPELEGFTYNPYYAFTLFFATMHWE